MSRDEHLRQRFTESANTTSVKARHVGQCVHEMSSGQFCVVRLGVLCKTVVLSMSEIFV